MEAKKIEQMWEEYKNLLLSTKRQGIEQLIDWLNKSDFKIAPASTKYHGSYEGGLIEHSLTVYKEAIRFTDLIELFKIPKDSLIITSLLHDVCKVNYYKQDMRNVKENGTWIKKPYYTVDDYFPIGHAEKSVIIIQQFIKINEIEIAMIRNHMGAFKDDMNCVSQLFSKYPESLVIHMADMIATYVIESPDMLDEFKNRLKKYMKNY